MSPLPASLGRYRVTEVLGEGAMGIVYKGFDPGIQRAVALKTVRRQLMEGTEFGQSMAARFRNEAQAAGRLSHPGIVAVYDYGEDGDVAFIAMEYVEGNSLAHYLANKVRFSDSDVLSVLTQLLAALEHAHEHGVWHRDIKPGNVIMTRHGLIKVADFGIARIESTSLTLVGSMIGTPSSMAPEQFLGHDIDRRVDVYGAGVLLYQLLVGQPPFTGSTESLMYRVVHEAPLLPSAVPGYPRDARFDAVVATALAKNAAQRFPTADAFRAALIAAAGLPAASHVSDETVVAVPARRMAGPAAAGGSTSGVGASTSAKTGGTSLNQKMLAQVEATLARHVGPLAAVLVRRTAPGCDSLPVLLSRLADQVTNPGARAAFLQQTGHDDSAQRSMAPTLVMRTGEAGAAPSASHSTAPAAASSAGATAGGGAAAADRPVDESLLASATKLLAQHIGPIASVVVKRSAARAANRSALFGLLADAVPDAAPREQLRAALMRLG